MSSNIDRFTVQWDAVDPMDETYPHLWVKVEHLGRYLFASGYLRSAGAERVADIGCGFGYGANELSQICRSVVGVDEDAAILEVARARYSRPNLMFQTATLGTDSFSRAIDPESLDGLVTFETLEHLTDPEAALAQIERSLRPSGTLLLSVPNSVAERLNDDGLPSNRLHKRFFTISSITRMVESTGFRVIEVLGQPLAGDVHRNETRLIRRKQLDGRVGDEPALHKPTTIRRLAATLGQPEPRDVERSYAIIVIARKS